MDVDQLPDERSIGGRTPYLFGGQLGLILLALPCAVSPSFEGMYEPFDCCLPRVTELVMSPLYGLLGGFTVLGMLVHAFARRDRLSRPALLAWSAVLLGGCLLLLYLFGLYAPLAPL
jgi:type II secretory pathway component PulF